MLTPKDHIIAKMEEHEEAIQAFAASNARVQMLEVQLSSEKRLRDKIWSNIGKAAFH